MRLPQEGLEARGPRRLRAFGPGSRYIIIWSVRLDSQIFEEALPLLDPKHNLRFEAAVVVAVHGESLMLIRSERGFTLIEMMIVVAIIGILSAIGVPAYLSYSARAQVMEGLSLAGGWKVAIVEYYAENGTWPSLPTDLNATPSAGVYASSVTVAPGGVIAIGALVRLVIHALRARN